MQGVFGEVCNCRSPCLRHEAGEFIRQDMDGLIDSCFAVGDYAPQQRAPTEYVIGTERQRDGDVGATPYAAIEHHLSLIHI